MTTNQTIDGVPRWVDKLGAQYRLCPVVGNLQIQIREAGRSDKWVEVSMTPAHALTHLSPLYAEQPASVAVARPAHANTPPGSAPCGTHRDNDGLDEMRKPAMCDCNQGRLPCNGKCK